MWVGPRALTLARLDAVLRTRNVPGIVVMPSAEPADFSALNWTPLAAVVLDHCLTAPALHTVLPDHQPSLLAALERLKLRGYMKPGLVVVRARDARVKYKWTAGFASFCQGERRRAHVPPLEEDRSRRRCFCAGSAAIGRT